MDAPLRGRRILVTRSRRQASLFSEQLRRLGAEVEEIPTIDVVLRDPAALVEALGRRAAYSDLVLTSHNGVQALARALVAAGLEATDLAGLRVSAVGSVTASALEALGLVVAVCPQRYDAEGLAEALEAQGVAGRRFLFPCASETREVLEARLEAAGAVVDVVAVYDVVPCAASARRLAALAPVDLVTVASSKTVRYFDGLLPEGGEAWRRVPLASIGPITTRTARQLGYTVVVEPAEATLEALTEAIVGWATGADTEGERG